MSEVQERQVQNVVTSENSAEFYGNRLGLADEPEVVAGNVEETPPKSEPISDANQSDPDADKEAKATEETKKSKLEMRFSEITKARREAEQQLEAERKARADLEERLKALETGKAPERVQDPAQKPQVEDFANAYDYAEALAKWSAEQALIERDRQEAERKAQAEQERLSKTWSEKVSKIQQELPDYDDMIASSTVKVSDAVKDAILESDVGPRLLYELASNDEFAEKIANLPPVKALKELGKLEAKFEAQADDKTTAKNVEPVVQKSKAPEPINPLRGMSNSGATVADAENLSFQDYRRLRKSGKIR